MTGAAERLLAGQAALVTGAQQGIGRAVALALGAAGADVVVNYLDDAAAAGAVVEAIRAGGGRAEAVAGDVAAAAAVAAMMDAAEALGGIRILVNNAGVFPRVDFLAMTEAEWSEVIDVNLKGAFLCTQAAARRMIERGQGGSVVNLSSSAAFRSSPRGVHYVASKAGIVGLTRACALELAPHRIRVNAVAPGLTDTAQPRYGMSEAEIARAAEGIPLGGLTRPEDVAAACVFLAGPGAERITGQTLHVNGGQYLY